jgi:ComF family protein
VVVAAPCAACGEPLEHPTRGPVCRPCWLSIPPPAPGLHAAGEYAGALKAIIHAFKYDGRRSLARPLAALMRERGAHLLSAAAAVVPVPLHPSRRRERGFNQAEDLARHLGLPMVCALRRVRRTSVQATLTAEERLTNVGGAFAATRHVRAIRGKAAVLVDDVSTTGATLEVCAQVLRAEGVSEVRVLTAARTLSRTASILHEDTNDTKTTKDPSCLFVPS